MCTLQNDFPHYPTGRHEKQLQLDGRLHDTCLSTVSTSLRSVERQNGYPAATDLTRHTLSLVVGSVQLFKPFKLDVLRNGTQRERGALQ